MKGKFPQIQIGKSFNGERKNLLFGRLDLEKPFIEVQKEAEEKMRSIFIIVVILWFCARIVTAFRITNEVNIDNFTGILNGTSLLLRLNNNGSQNNETIDEIVDDFDEIETTRYSTQNDTFDLDEPFSSMETIDGKTNDSIELNHSVQHSRALVASSRDPMRGIIFRQKVKPEPRSFFGLIIIPCKCKVIHF